jgi:hypothetical protein
VALLLLELPIPSGVVAVAPLLARRSGPDGRASPIWLAPRPGQARFVPGTSAAA